MSISGTESVGPGPTPATGSTYGTGGTDTTASASGTTSDATSQMNKDMFLKLMVAQLRNQDPMNPTDSTAFLAQTAQFTSLEKMEDLTSQSALALNAQMAFGASGLVGKDVTYVAADGTESPGTVSSVRFTATGPVLHIGDTDVAMSNVVAVGPPGSASQSTPATPTVQS